MSSPLDKRTLHELIERVEKLEQELFKEKSKIKKHFTIQELSYKTGFSVNTLYKKIKILEINKHYFKPNGGKLLFDESAVDFLVKGGNSKNGESIHKKGQPIYLGDFLG